MERDAIKSTVIEVFSSYVRDESLLEGDLENKDMIKDLKINSARFVDLILDLEDAFDIIIEDSISDQIITVGDTIDLIQKKLQ